MFKDNTVLESFFDCKTEPKTHTSTQIYWYKLQLKRGRKLECKTKAGFAKSRQQSFREAQCLLQNTRAKLLGHNSFTSLWSQLEPGLSAFAKGVLTMCSCLKK